MLANVLIRFLASIFSVYTLSLLYIAWMDALVAAADPCPPAWATDEEATARIVATDNTTDRERDTFNIFFP